MLLIGLVGLASDAALLAERVAIVCTVAGTPTVAAPAAAEIPVSQMLVDDSAFIEPMDDDILPSVVFPRESSAGGALYHPSPAVWKPP